MTSVPGGRHRDAVPTTARQKNCTKLQLLLRGSQPEWSLLPAARNDKKIKQLYTSCPLGYFLIALRARNCS